MTSRSSVWPARAAAPLGLLALLVPAACGDSSSDTIDDASSTCDQLEELTNAYLDARDARTNQEFAGIVELPRHAYLEAAETSGDDQLAELAETYDDAFSTAYLDRNEANDAQAVDDANRALDHAAGRCIDLGADNDFPTQP